MKLANYIVYKLGFVNFFHYNDIANFYYEIVIINYTLIWHIKRVAEYVDKIDKIFEKITLKDQTTCHKSE